FTTPGAHQIRMRTTDEAGNVSFVVHYDLFIDLTGPSATIEQITPAIRDTAVSTVDITFSEPINGVTLDYHDLVLKNGAGANLIDSSVQLLFLGNSSFRVTGLGPLTGAAGLYTLSLNLGGVEDLAGNP